MEGNTMQVWLDDERPAPSGWIHVKTPWEAIELLKTGNVTEISLDNDLGLLSYDPPNEGYDVAKFIEQGAITGTLPQLQVYIHTQNPVAKTKMKMAIQNAYRAWQNADT